MSIPVLRTADGWWIQVDETRALRIETGATTTAELIADRAAVTAARADASAAPSEDLTRIDDLTLVSPVTAPCRVVAQMTNFESHVRESGLDPATIPLTFFRKASGSLSGPYDDVVRPAHVEFLDYEVEIGVVVGEPLVVGTTVTPETVSRHVAGLVITNDVSARDVQLPKTQFFEAKSYPTFTPVGPVLLILEAGDWERFSELRLRLSVNGEVRQDSTTAEMIYSPAESFAALSRFQRMDTGDLLLTGTPGGTALRSPGKLVERIAALLPPTVKWKVFFKKQAENPNYLADGDVIEIGVFTPDGALDLGTQRTTVRWTP